MERAVMRGCAKADAIPEAIRVDEKATVKGHR